MSRYETKTDKLGERLAALPVERQKQILRNVAEYLCAEGQGEQLEWFLDQNAEYATLMERDADAENTPLSIPKAAVSNANGRTSYTAPSPSRNLPMNQIVCGDNIELIRQLPDNSIQLVITSPPYFQQRDYGGGMGNENHVEEYLARLLMLFRECVRVLQEDGSIVFNLGDKYQDSSLLLVPYRFAIAATETRCVRLVNNVTWVKQNPTPRQFQRRLVSSTEPFFHFVKSDRYFYDLAAFQSEGQNSKKANGATSQLGKRYVELIEQSDLSLENKQMARIALANVVEEVKAGEIAGFRMKIRGIHSEPFGGQEGGRKIQLEKNGFTIIRIHGNKLKRDVLESPVESIKGCKHPAIYPVEIVEEFLRLLTRPGDVVLDPFMGSGSTGVACKHLKRHYIGYDINPEYCEVARERIASVENQPSSLFEGDE